MSTEFSKAVSNWWTGLLEWTTGMDFDLFFFFFFPQELTIYIEELVYLTLAHAGLACKVVLARAVPKDSTRALRLKKNHAHINGII